jgi:DNA-binding beta-propeller fold protein YncE
MMPGGPDALSAAKGSGVAVVKLSLSEPEGMRFDAHDHLYVADTGNDRIVELSTSGKLLLTWGRKGSGPAEFDAPEGVGVDPQGDLYVGDFNNRRLVKLSPAGAQLASWKAGDQQFGCECRDAVVDGAGNLYVADESTIYLYRMSLGLTHVRKWDTGTSSVVAVAVDRKNNVWIVTAGDDVREISPSGKLLTHWGKHGKKARQFDGPQAIAANRTGHVYVADSRNDRVQELSSSGKVQTIFGRGKSELSQASNPEGVAVDRRGRVYVADTYHGRIQVFSPQGVLLAVWGASG